MNLFIIRDDVFLFFVDIVNFYDVLVVMVVVGKNFFFKLFFKFKIYLFVFVCFFN